MSFCSLQFLIFFPVVTALYFAVPHPARWALLLVASCIFYMAFVPAYILILAAMIVVDYFAGLAIARAAGRRRLAFLVLSLVANIGTLAFFKYYNFFVANISDLLNLTNFHVSIPTLEIILPIGLSFHTFQAMSYTIEVYRGNQPPETHFGIYALYVMFYPQLVAGPIERPQNLLPQFHRKHDFSYENVRIGLQHMIWGFFKKTVVADRLALGVDTVYRDPSSFQGQQLILATVLFAIQLYADFSGYSDIAVGSAKVMGIDLMRNFKNPYGASNISEFWRRWHISLYSWFNDYLYTPLAVSLRQWGKAGVVFAVLVTFAISGLWHGPAWKFVVWGALHGLAISLELLTRRKRTKLFKPIAWFVRPLGVVLTFGYVCFCFIFFRALSFADACYVVSHLLDGLGPFLRNSLRPGVVSQTVGALGFYRQEFWLGILSTVIMFAVESIHARYNLRPLFERRHIAVRWAAYYAIGVAIVFYGAYNATQPFIYFQF